jgi:hypothetical protein
VPTWIDLSQGRGCIELGQTQARFLSDHYGAQSPTEAEQPLRPSHLASAPATPAILPALIQDERLDRQAIVDAIRENAPILS